jgi:molybdopterin molybdotransferase
MAEFLQVVSYEEAVARLKCSLKQRFEEEIPLLNSRGRVLSRPILSPEDMPAFNRSTVDGYAVNAVDSFGASESLPAFFQCIGAVPMGSAPTFSLESGRCAWIPTGGMMPMGGDAAVMVEYTEKLGDDTILAYRPVSPGENVMLKGEDVSSGQVLFTAGHRLRPQDIGLLASLGVERVLAFSPYRIGIISSGDEVVPVKQAPAPGQVRDVNSYSLAAAVEEKGHLPCIYPLVGDDMEQLRGMVAKSLQENDITLLSGGSSVGIADLTVDVLLSFAGAELLFHGLAVKPGKPTLGVKIKDGVVIGLPGHPVSALMMFQVLSRYLLESRPIFHINARLSHNIASQPGRDDFIPVELSEEGGRWAARPLLGKSGLMGILARANGYIHIKSVYQGLKEGETCRVYLF